MYPLTAGIVVQTKSLWDELQAALQDLPVRVILELSDIGELGALREKIDRVRPEVMLIDVSDLREPLEAVIRGVRSTAATPAVIALNTIEDTKVILAAMRAGATEYLHPPFAEPLRTAL